jgi:uncharacterized protein
MADQTFGHTPIDYIEIPVLDIAKSKAFYGSLFGWEFEDYHAEYAGFSHGKGNGGFQKVDSVSRGGALVVLYTKNLDAMLQKVREAGAEISKEEISFPGGRRFQFIDPSGNELGVWSDDKV